MAKNKKQEEVLSEQIPLESVVDVDDVSAEFLPKNETKPEETKKKKEKKVSRKKKKADKKKAEKEALLAAEQERTVTTEEKTEESETREEPKEQTKKSSKKKAEEPVPETVEEKVDEKIEESETREKPKKQTKKSSKKKTEEPVSETVEEKVDEKIEESETREKPKKQTKKSSKKKTEEPVSEKVEEKVDEKTEESETREKPKKQTKKSSKKKTEEPASETVEEKATEKTEDKAIEKAEKKKEDKIEDSETREKPKKKRQSKKISEKSNELELDSLFDKDIERISKKDITLEDAFAGLENQLKELDKAIEEKPKKTKKSSKQAEESTLEISEGKAEQKAEDKAEKKSEEKAEKKSEKKPKKKAEEKLEEISKEKPEEIVEAKTEEKSDKKDFEVSKEETPSRSFMKEFTIQLGPKTPPGDLEEEQIDEEKGEDISVSEKPKKKRGKKSSKKAQEKDSLAEAKVEEGSSEKKSEAKALPSAGKLQDIKGDDIEDFIEMIETVDTEVETADEVAHEPADVHIKPLPRLLTHFVPVQGDSVFEIIRKGFVVICLVLLIVSMVVLVDSTRKDDGKPDDDIGALNGYGDNFAINETSDDLPEGVLDKYHSLYNVNNDMVGWLTLPGTPIDMPVVQYIDNEFYETTDFNGNDLVGLVAFADSNSPMKTLARQTVLYVATGENYGEINGLQMYKSFSESGEKTKPYTLSFGTLYSDYEWEIIACIETENVDEAMSKLSSEDFTGFTEYILEETIYPRELVNIKSGDKTLILRIPCADLDTKTSDAEKHLLLIARLVVRQTDDQ